VGFHFRNPRRIPKFFDDSEILFIKLIPIVKIFVESSDSRQAFVFDFKDPTLDSLPPAPLFLDDFSTTKCVRNEI
jgi:hypothetical protein